MKTRTKKLLLLALAIVSFVSNLYSGMNWSSWINGAFIGYLYKMWLGDKNA
jgi:hypothetical protein